MEIKGLSLLEQLNAIKGVDPIRPAERSPQPSKAGQGSFLDYLQKTVNETNELNVEADKRMQLAAAGEDESPHETMIAVQKADISFRLMLSVKEKLLSAYQQVIRTPL